jgi:hypothetical protein
VTRASIRLSRCIATSPRLTRPSRLGGNPIAGAVAVLRPNGMICRRPHA